MLDSETMIRSHDFDDIRNFVIYALRCYRSKKMKALVSHFTILDT